MSDDKEMQGLKPSTLGDWVLDDEKVGKNMKESLTCALDAQKTPMRNQSHRTDVKWAWTGKDMTDVVIELQLVYRPKCARVSNSKEKCHGVDVPHLFVHEDYRKQKIAFTVFQIIESWFVENIATDKRRIGIFILNDNIHEDLEEDHRADTSSFLKKLGKGRMIPNQNICGYYFCV